MWSAPLRSLFECVLGYAMKKLEMFPKFTTSNAAPANTSRVTLEPPCDSVSLTSKACPTEFVTACFAQLRPSSRVGAGLHHLAPL
jgi:hypothetical protein